MSQYKDFIEKCRREGVAIPLGNPFSTHCIMCGEALGGRRLCPIDPARRDCASSFEVLARESLVFDPTLCFGECMLCGLPLLVDLVFAFTCPKHPNGGWCFSRKAHDKIAARRT